MGMIKAHAFNVMGVHQIRVGWDEDCQAWFVDSDLKDFCRFCEDPACYRDCDLSKAAAAEDHLEETDHEITMRRSFNAAIDGMESLLLALLADNVINPESPNIVQALETSIDAITREFG